MNRHDELVFQPETVMRNPGSGPDEAWQVLVVDDDPDVHRATALALMGIQILGYPVSLQSATTAQGARAELENNPNIAVILLDVVMESPDAGLALVRTIREQLNNHEIRIILRTGQPGYAPEFRVIMDYDINDYRTKTELTQERLITCLTTALRSWQQMWRLNHLRAAASRDVLTSLLNRSAFVERLAEFDCAPDSDCVLALMDLDHFSDINHALGQALGDHCLVEVARRLERAVGSDTLLARVDSDVFGLLGERRRLAPERLRGLLDQPIQLDENQVPVNVTLGYLALHTGREAGLTRLNRSFMALAHAKAESTRAVAWFTPELELVTRRRLEQIRDLREAFAQQHLYLAYQPQFEIATGSCVGLEALLRWRTPAGEEISPGQFVPLAEQSGLMLELGYWVLSQACAEVLRLHQAGDTHLKINVNVSMMQFRAPGFVSNVRRLLDECGLPPGTLVLEITESIVMDDPDAVLSALAELRAMGCLIALDDFGTGFSSLGYLRQMPLDRIKIDMSFVQEIELHSNQAIVQAIIRLAKEFSLDTVAEGVETDDQLRQVGQLGCYAVQGFLFSPALASPQLWEYLGRSRY